jgi:hypothetical protein
LSGYRSYPTAMTAMQTMKMEFDTPARLLDLQKSKRVGLTDPTPSRAIFLNYFLNFFLPRKARPIMPTPIRNSVDASGTDDIPTLSAKAVSGKSKKTNKNDAANSTPSFISSTPFQIPPFVYIALCKIHAKNLCCCGIFYLMK